MLQTTEETELTMPSDFRWHSFLVSAGYLPDTEYPISDTVSHSDNRNKTETLNCNENKVENIQLMVLILL